jgi:hypothetical protein
MAVVIVHAGLPDVASYLSPLFLFFSLSVCVWVVLILSIRSFTFATGREPLARCIPRWEGRVPTNSERQPVVWRIKDLLLFLFGWKFSYLIHFSYIVFAVGCSEPPSGRHPTLRTAPNNKAIVNRSVHRNQADNLAPNVGRHGPHVSTLFNNEWTNIALRHCSCFPVGATPSTPSSNIPAPISLKTGELFVRLTSIEVSIIIERLSSRNWAYVAEWVPRDVQTTGWKPHPVETGEILTRKILKGKFILMLMVKLNLNACLIVNLNVFECIESHR